MASVEPQVPRRPVISAAVDCTCTRRACAPFDGSGAEATRTGDPVYFRVVRKSLSQLCVISQDGTETVWLNMGRMFNPFGLEWRVSSTAQACDVVVKKAFMSGVVTFENTDGAALASLTHSLCSTSSKLHWKGSTYRWETTHTGLPLTLQLINLTTNTVIAHLKGAASTPWSKEQYILTVAAGQYGPTWLQVVAASAIAEAQRVNGRFSSSGAGGTLAAM